MTSEGHSTPVIRLDGHKLEILVSYKCFLGGTTQLTPPAPHLGLSAASETLPASSEALPAASAALPAAFMTLPTVSEALPAAFDPEPSQIQ